jgi:hypothetical protein
MSQACEATPVEAVRLFDLDLSRLYRLGGCLSDRPVFDWTYL